MINGAHVIIYSTDADADRAFLRDVLRFPSVDVGDGWLIFGLPPSEVAVHPGASNGTHELYLMCDDVQAVVDTLTKLGRPCEPVADQGWGIVTSVTLPGGGRLAIYQPRHPRPPQAGVSARPTRKAATKPASRKSAPKKTAKKAPTSKAARKAPTRKAAKKVASRKR